MTSQIGPLANIEMAPTDDQNDCSKAMQKAVLAQLAGLD
jgi:hypothetical protein